MKVLIPLTEWEERIAIKGRGKGNRIKSRKVLGVDNWNWFIGLEQEGCQIIREASYGSVRMLMMYSELCRSNAQNIIDKLCEYTGVEMKINTDQDSETLGTAIDDVYGTSFMREYPPKVYKNIFKEESDDSLDDA